MNKEQFIEELKKLKINIDEDTLNKLEIYYTLLVKTNENINLTSITNQDDVYLKHFYDSLTIAKVIDLNKEISLCDIGTGAGFPGLVLKIVFPTLNITLVDALDKRIKFLDKVIETLNLKNIKTIHSRIEDLNEKEKYDIVVSRAVAKISTLLELGSQLPKVGGYFIFMKSESEEELRQAKVAMKTLNYQYEKTKKFQLPIENSKRSIIKIKKVSSTSSKYPRQFSQIKKKPL